MSDSAEKDPAAPAKAGGGMVGKIINGVGIFVLSLAAVVAGGVINGKMHPAPNYKLDKDGNLTAVGGKPASTKESEEAAKAVSFYPIDPPLVVNFEDGSAVRFLQISMSLMAHDPKAIESATKNMPLIRNNLLLVMSNRNSQTLMTREGKDKLREEALAEVRAVQKKEGGPDIDDLLFTSFVVQ